MHVLILFKKHNEPLLLKSCFVGVTITDSKDKHLCFVRHNLEFPDKIKSSWESEVLMFLENRESTVGEVNRWVFNWIVFFCGETTDGDWMAREGLEDTAQAL